MKIGISIVGIVTFWILFSRKPHTAFQEVNGELIPVQFQPQQQQFVQQPGGYNQQQPYQGFPQGGYQQSGYPQSPPPPPSSGSSGYSSPYNYNPGQYAGGSMHSYKNYGNSGHMQSNYQ